MLAAVNGQAWNATQIGQSLGLSYHTVNFLGQAQNLFGGQDKELASIFAKIEEHKKAIDVFNKTIDQKFDGKSEDELSDGDKRLLKTLNANIEAENQAIAQIVASQKSVLDKFNDLVAQVKTRLGK